jgi:hypothetical protein
MQSEFENGFFQNILKEQSCRKQHIKCRPFEIHTRDCRTKVFKYFTCEPVLGYTPNTVQMEKICSYFKFPEEQ